MKILILTSSYYPITGGVQTITRNLAIHYKKRGDDVCVVTSRYPRHLATKEKVDDIPVKRFLFISPKLDYLRTRRFDLLFAAIFLYPITLIQFLWVIFKFKPEVVNMHFPDHQIPFVLTAKKIFKFCLVVSLHGDEIERFFNDERIFSKSCIDNVRRILKSAHKITACSKYLLDHAVEIEKSSALKGEVIHNGIDIESFKNAPLRTKENPYILAYGRLDLRKGFDLLIQAYAQAHEKFPKYDLVIAGSGGEESRLKELIKFLKIEKFVTLYGYAPQQDLCALIQGCRFFVMPSRKEPFGVVSLEAMAAGKVVLATKVGGVSEFLKAEGNHLVAPEVDAIASGLNLLMSKSSEELNIHGKMNIEHAGRFTVDIMGDKYLNLLKAGALCEA